MKPILVAKYKRGTPKDDQQALEQKISGAAKLAGCVPILVPEDVSIMLLYEQPVFPVKRENDET